MAAWQLVACAKVSVVVSIAEAQLRNLFETSLTLRWSVALTMLRMSRRISFGTLLIGPEVSSGRASCGPGVSSRRV